MKAIQEALKEREKVTLTVLYAWAIVSVTFIIFIILGELLK